MERSLSGTDGRWPKLRRLGVRQGYETTYLTYIVIIYLVFFVRGATLQPRAIYLYDLGLSLAAYGLLTSFGSLAVVLTQRSIGRFSDGAKTRKAILLVAFIVASFAAFAFGSLTLPFLLGMMMVIDMVAQQTYNTISGASVSQ